MKNALTSVALVAILLVLTFVELRAGERSSVRGMGMARTAVVSSRGLDGVGVNPASLGVRDSGTVTFTFLPLSGHIGSDFLSYDLYTKYFTGVSTDSGRVGRYLTEADKNVIISSFEDPLPRTTLNVEATLLGLSCRIGPGVAAFTVADHLGAFADIPRDYIAFLLKGNPVGSAYSFEGTRVLASWTREYSLSFGSRMEMPLFRSFAVGAATKLVHGFGYYEVQRFNTSLITDEHATLTGSVDFLSRRAGLDPASARFISTYRLFPAVAGKGVGVDVGAWGNINGFLSIAASLTDIGSIRWNKNTEIARADTTITVDDPLNEQQRNMVEDVVRGEKRPGGSFATSLPTTFRAGIAMEVHKIPEMRGMRGQLLLELDYCQTLVETPFSTKAPRVSLGVEYSPIRWLPLRSGVSFGGVDHLNLAFGLGIILPVFEFEIASENVTWLFAPKSFSRGSVAVGTRFRI